MRALGVVLARAIIAVLVGGLVMPAILFAVPRTRASGPFVLALLVAVLFGLLRLVWPSRRRNT